MRTLLPVALFLAGLPACASGPLGRAGVLAGRSLARDVPVLVMGVPDAHPEGQEAVPNSGASVSMAVRRQLAAQGLDALSDPATDRAQAFAAARELGCGLVAQTEILTWHDAGSDWVHAGDSLALLLTLWAVEDELPVAWGADELEDRSMDSGREPPHRLAEPLMTLIVKALLAPDATAPPFEEA